jgi:hypothetical protein
MVYTIIYYPIKYALFILSGIDVFFTKTIYEKLFKAGIENSALVRSLLFIFTFYFTIYFIYNFTRSIKNTLIDVIMCNMNTWYVPILMVMCFFPILIDIVLFFIDNRPFLTNWLYLIIFIILSILYFIFFIYITPIIASIFIVFYFIIYSLFGISITADLTDTIEKIIKTCSISDNIKHDTFCKELTWFDTFYNYMVMFFDFWYKYVFNSAYLFLFLYNSANCLKTIHSDTLRSILHVINFSMVFIILLYSIFDYNRKNAEKQEEKEYCDPSKQQCFDENNEPTIEKQHEEISDIERQNDEAEQQEPELTDIEEKSLIESIFKNKQQTKINNIE